MAQNPGGFLTMLFFLSLGALDAHINGASLFYSAFNDLLQAH